MRRSRWVALALMVTVGVTGCSDSGGGDGGSDDQVTSIDIKIEGDDVTPNGEQVEVPVDEPIELHITADEPGELHVHSTPEQEIEYPAGDSTQSVTIERPGVVEVESHDTEKIIVKLEAS